MNQHQTYKKFIRIFGYIGLLLIPAYLGVKLFFFSPNDQKIVEPSYVGASTCIECHKKEFDDWKGSDHDLAMDTASNISVIGDFNNAQIKRGDQIHKAYKKGDDFFVWTDGEEGIMKEYQVKYTFGHYPLQQYLVEFEDGRLQTLALSWNSLDSNWYYMADSVYKDMNVNHENWLHWTNQSQNWNSMCADCHSTNLQMGFNIEKNSYHTTYSEIDVSCETCHGPASEHLKWANKPNYLRASDQNWGLSAQTSNIDNEAYVNLCARCHSRRSSFKDFEPHNQSIYNHMLPVLPVEPFYHIDGQILEEDYVFASFTQSKMFMNDVKCNDCHNVHSGKLILEGNALCLQCHQADSYDTPGHHFHKNIGEKGDGLTSEAGMFFDVGSGAQCINCHMHGQNYMGVDYRRDHSFRIPRPDLTVKLGSPNACNQCHTQKSASWSQEYIEKWYGSSRPYQYGEAFHDANMEKEGSDAQLRKMMSEELYAMNIRVAAMMYLGDQSIIENKEAIFLALQHIHPLMRIYAIRKLEVHNADDLNKLFPLLYDETKAVRIELASKLGSVPAEYIPKKYKEPYENISQEYLEMLKYNGDFPIGKYNLGNYYYNRSDFDNAEVFFLKALEQDEELHEIKINLAFLYSSMGQPVKSEILLKDYLQHNPENYSAYYNLGLILAENKKYEESLEYLIIASKNMPYNSRVDYNIAMMYEFFKNLEKTELYLKKAIDKEPSQFNYSNLLEFYSRTQQQIKANRVAEEIQGIFEHN